MQQEQSPSQLRWEGQGFYSQEGRDLPLGPRPLQAAPSSQGANIRKGYSQKPPKPRVLTF